MDDRKLYETILGLAEPWYVAGVALRAEREEIEVQVELRPGAPLTRAPGSGRVHHRPRHRTRSALHRRHDPVHRQPLEVRLRLKSSRSPDQVLQRLTAFSAPWCAAKHAHSCRPAARESSACSRSRSTWRSQSCARLVIGRPPTPARREPRKARCVAQLTSHLPKSGSGCRG